MRYGGVLSEAMNVPHGVPEGSILGPHLFNMYINSLLKSLPPDSAVAYADDVTLIVHGKTAAETTRNMQDLLCVINIWAAKNLMATNPSKCLNMLISPYLRKHIDKNEQHRVTLGNQTLVTVLPTYSGR